MSAICSSASRDWLLSLLRLRVDAAGLPQARRNARRNNGWRLMMMLGHAAGAAHVLHPHVRARIGKVAEGTGEGIDGALGDARLAGRPRRCSRAGADHCPLGLAVTERTAAWTTIQIVGNAVGPGDRHGRLHLSRHPILPAATTCRRRRGLAADAAADAARRLPERRRAAWEPGARRSGRRPGPTSWPKPSSKPIAKLSSPPARPTKPLNSPSRGPRNTRRSGSPSARSSARLPPR